MKNLIWGIVFGLLFTTGCSVTSKEVGPLTQGNDGKYYHKVTTSFSFTHEPLCEGTCYAQHFKGHELEGHEQE